MAAPDVEMADASEQEDPVSLNQTETVVRSCRLSFLSFPFIILFLFQHRLIRLKSEPAEKPERLALKSKSGMPSPCGLGIFAPIRYERLQQS
jgi:hypothetical protein